MVVVAVAGILALPGAVLTMAAASSGAGLAVEGVVGQCHTLSYIPDRTLIAPVLVGAS